MISKVFNNALIGIIGFILSAYSVYVEHKVEHKDDPNDEYSALCDIEAIGASCSAVFSLPEGKMLSYFGIVPHGHILDIPNGVLGMFFYTYTIIRYFIIRKLKQKLKKLNSAVNHKDNDKKLKPNILFASSVNMIISTLAIASSLLLGRKLWVLKELCVVCVSTHIINTTLWMRSIDELATPNTSISMDNPNVKGVTLHKVPPKKKQ